MGLALALITVGGIVAYSGFKGVSVADALGGLATGKLNPKGGSIKLPAPGYRGDGTGDTQEDAPGSTSPKSFQNPYGFGGPNAYKLASAASVAERGFNLKITSTSGGTHAPNSWHYKHRAFDASGAAADQAAFARWLVAEYGAEAIEIFYDPSNIAIKNGSALGHNIGGHSDHVHFAI